MSSEEIQRAVSRLDQLARRLRRECPWDREQDERSIVSHTVEEAYELADAAHARDDAKLLDELGDVLFQVHFLALLLEERGAGDLAAVADACTEKLIRRHPHVFGEVQVAGAEEVLRNWDAIKREEPGRDRAPFAEVPETLPGLLHARKIQRRAAAGGFDFASAEQAVERLHRELVELDEVASLPPAEAGPRAGETARPEAFAELGDVLFAVVSVARKLGLDPELALRASSERFRARVEAATARARRSGDDWSSLGPERQLELYRAVADGVESRAGS